MTASPFLLDTVDQIIDDGSLYGDEAVEWDSMPYEAPERYRRAVDRFGSR